MLLHDCMILILCSLVLWFSALYLYDVQSAVFSMSWKLSLIVFSNQIWMWNQTCLYRASVTTSLHWRGRITTWPALHTISNHQGTRSCQTVWGSARSCRRGLTWTSSPGQKMRARRSGRAERGGRRDYGSGDGRPGRPGPGPEPVTQSPNTNTEVISKQSTSLLEDAHRSSVADAATAVP